MGKIITKGYASREVEYDHMEITMKFHVREYDTKTAIRKITEECEAFLKKMKDSGVDVSKIKAGSNSVEKDSYGEKRFVEAQRALTMEIPYDLNILDSIMKMTEADSLSADIDIDYSYSSEEETRNQLLKEATANARKKADLMAAATGTKVAGVERIKVERNNDDRRTQDERRAILERAVSS